MGSVVRFLGSVGLTLGVLLSLALLAAAGTLPRQWAPFADPFHHPLFAGLLCLLALNVGACTWQRLAARLRGGRARALSCRSLADAALHLSVLVILASGVLKGLGEQVLTQNVRLGAATRTAYDWRAEADVPLGFTLAVADYFEEPYPVRARIGVSRRDTGEGLFVAEVVEGGETFRSGAGLYLRMVRFGREEGFAFLEVGEGGGTAERIALGVREGGGKVAEYGPYRLTVLAYRSQPRTVRGLVSIREEGRPVREEWLAPNGQLRHRDLRLSLTAWGSDHDGRPFVGIQIVRNPGAPLFWAGCVLLSLAVPALLACRRARPGATAGGDGAGEAAPAAG